MNSSSQQSSPAVAAASSNRIALVVLNIYATTATHLHAYLSAGAHISSPDLAYEFALELFKNTRLGGDVIWISAEGVTLDELAQLEKKWLPVAGKAIMFLGSNEMPVVNRSMQGLMAARRDNTAFEAVILTHKDASDNRASTTARLIASQSAGWLHHEVKDPLEPQASIAKVMSLLKLGEHPKIAPTNALAAPLAQAHASTSPPEIAVPPHTPEPEPEFDLTTLTRAMDACMLIDGALGAALCDESNGMALAKIGGGSIDLDVAAAGNTEVVKTKMDTMRALDLNDLIEDILITLDTQYHVIRPLPAMQGLFLYLILDKSKSNLAMARYKLKDIEKGITIEP